MKYSIDKIIDNIVVIENINTKEKKEIDITNFPSDTKEGNIVVEKESKYILDKETEIERRNMLRNKLERLKKLKWKN